MTDIRLETAIAAPHELLFVPLGGAGEIGMNLSVYGYGGKWVIVDLGVTFADDSLPGIDVVMPDPAFIVDRRDDLLGIVATHAHEDHIGAIPYLWPQLRCPVYATAFTASVLRRKLQEAGLIHEVPLHVVPSSGRFSLEPFEFELIHLTHSIPEPNAVVLRTPAGTVLHTGDWKFDPDPLIGAASDFDALRRLGDEGVTALIGDSTNVFRPGEAGSEATVRRRLSEVIGRYSGKVAVACFASNIARLESVALAAAGHDRQVALVGRSLRRMDQAARENGYLTRLPPFLSEEAARVLPSDKTLLLCTGSQGEPRAALSRIAANQHPNIALAEGDAVIFSSRIIPGNEKAIGRLHDRLAGNGVEVLSAEQDAQLHVSGHPARDELIRMYELVRPRLAIPVHGALRHLVEHAELAKACQVPTAMVVENGSVVRLGPGRAAILDRVPTGRLAVDGNRLIRIDGMAIRDRHKLLYGGSATATLVLDRKGGFLAEPVVSLRGLTEPDDEVDLIERGQKAVREAVFAMPSGALGDDPAVREVARLALRRAISNRTGRKPLTDIHLVRLSGVA